MLVLDFMPAFRIHVAPLPAACASLPAKVSKQTDRLGVAVVPNKSGHSHNEAVHSVAGNSRISFRSHTECCNTGLRWLRVVSLRSSPAVGEFGSAEFGRRGIDGHAPAEAPR